MKNLKTLPQRAFNSPLLMYANFEGGKHLNLIRLNKPYKNGASYAIHSTTGSKFSFSGMYTTYEKAKLNFDIMVNNVQQEMRLIECKFTENIYGQSKSV